MIDNALYYGNAEQASDRKVINNLKITHIVNVTNMDFKIKWNENENENENKKEEKDKQHNEIKYLKLAIHDNEDNKISKYFETANKFINDALMDSDHDNRVLVHCMFGSSRSGTILVQYIMNRNKISLFKAYKYIYKCRPCLYPNSSFMDELEESEMRLFNIDKTKTSRKQIEESEMR